MTTAKRLGRPPVEGLREQRRDEILAAAASLFAEKGFAGADTQELADRVGVAKGTLYRYFASKEELFLAAVDHLMEQLRQAVDAAANEHLEPFQQMRAALESYLRFFESHPAAVELIIQERAHFRDRATPTYFAHREKNMGRWRDLIARLMVEGRVRRMSVDRIVTVVNDLVYGAMFTNYFTGRRFEHAQQAADILDIVFRGILSDQERQADAGATSGGNQS